MTEVRKHRSVSQLNQFTRCSWAYYLSRTVKAWERPAAWLGQGSAVHEAAEAWEKSGRTLTLEETQDVFRESYARHIGEACEITPNYEYWYASGPYRGEVDVERRYGIGLEQVEKFIQWSNAQTDRVIWISPEGVPGIEISFDVTLDDVLVRGFIDQVAVVDGEVRVVDLKTGNQPGDDFQLGTYAVALAEQFGIEQPKTGTYWMGRTGKETYPYDLTEWTRDRVSEKFSELETAIQSEAFEPSPEPSKCRFCSVSMACVYRAD